MSKQVSRGSAGEYQSDERAGGVARVGHDLATTRENVEYVELLLSPFWKIEE